MKSFRFWYDGGWTRWLEDEEIEIVRHLTNIERVEIVEQVSKEQFNREFPELAIK